MAFARIGGQLLHYRLDGVNGAPAVAFANSLGTDFRIWDGVVSQLKDRYRLLRYDMRGHGLSDAPAGAYRLEQHVADLRGLIGQLGLTRIALVGVSVGGLVAQGFALAHAGMLAGLALMDTAARIGDAAGWQARIDAVSGNGMRAISDTVLQRWFDPDYRVRHEEDFAGWRHMLERTPAAGYAGTCATLRDTDLSRAVAGIDGRTLVLVGETDASTPPQLVRDTAARLPKARLELIAGAGHLPNIERPAAVAAALERYFMEIGLV